MHHVTLELRINDGSDLEALWRVFEEFRDVQDVGLSKLPNYCSGWKEADSSNGISKHFVRKPAELDDGRMLHVGVRVWNAGHADIIIRMGDQ